MLGALRSQTDLYLVYMGELVAYAAHKYQTIIVRLITYLFRIQTDLPTLKEMINNEKKSSLK